MENRFGESYFCNYSIRILGFSENWLEIETLS